MTADDLRAWQTAMGYTQQEAAQQLGISWATYKRHLVGAPPLQMALACAALAAGLSPWWQPPQRPKRAKAATA